VALLQPQKWQLTGIDCSTAAQLPIARANDSMQPAGILRPNQPR